MAIKYRLAPTPSGFLHLGNAVNFLLNYQAQKAKNAQLLLRIDDLDAERKRPEYLQDIFDSLVWLGIDWDEGPRNIDDFGKNWSQYTRMDLYEQTLQNLQSTGLLYACQKSRKDLEGLSTPDLLKNLRSQNLSLNQKNVAWRIQTPNNFDLPDFVVRKKDGIPAYQVASLTDDVHFGVTDIVRGQDLEASSKAQQFLAEILGLTSFLSINIVHHPLILDENGVKLSKSKGASSLKSMRESGKSKEEILKLLKN
jgi:glutamyl/glutaminyl-tRNA synthetase